jgi:cytochrome c oxidase cbb3-type subunit IV
MDVNDLRAIVTVAGLVLFLALVARTWSRRAKASHDEAARLPFLGDTLGEARPEGEHP